MKRKLLILFLILAIVSAVGLAFADPGGGGGGGGNGGGNGNGHGNGTQNPPPENPPCDADNHLVDLPRGLLDKCGEEPGTEGPPGDETCDDGIDNDGDGKTDQEDEDCQEPEGPPGDETCDDDIDNDGDGLTDEDDPDCQDGDGATTCSTDFDGDGEPHSAFAPENNEGGLASSIVHGIDQGIPPPIAGDQGLVTEVNCAVIVSVEEILGING